MDWVGVGSPFGALVSFGSDDLNESLPQRAISQFTSSSHGQRTQVEIVSPHLFVAAVLIGC